MTNVGPLARFSDGSGGLLPFQQPRPGQFPAGGLLYAPDAKPDSGRFRRS
jgi:hypothetical protein